MIFKSIKVIRKKEIKKNVGKTDDFKILKHDWFLWFWHTGRSNAVGEFVYAVTAAEGIIGRVQQTQREA